MKTPSRTVAGLGPHGERPATPDTIVLTPEMRDHARSRAFRIAIVLHTTASDWSQRQIAGITSVLHDAAAVVVDVVDCSYDASTQIAAIDALELQRPDAVISIPFGSGVVADAFHKLSTSGIKLIFLDNAPAGLLPDRDYASVVSCDNFGLGQLAAGLLSPYVPAQGKICVVAYKIDFFATAQREIAFRKWMRRERPDVTLTQVKFETPARVGDVIGPYLDRHPDVDGLFVLWDEVAVETLRFIKPLIKRPVMTTVDLGRAVAAALAEGSVLKGVAAQHPYEQGAAAALAAIVALVGASVPPWIVLPGLAVTADNVVAAYQTVGGTPSSPEWQAQPVTDKC